MAHQERGIRRGIALAALVTMAVFILFWLLVPLFFTFPEAPDEKLALALKANLFIAITLVAAVAMVSTTRRVSPDDIGGAAYGPPSPRLAVKSAFLQNTLEQAVIAAMTLAAFAALASGPFLALIPATVILFIAGRILFYRAYPGGAASRSFGMALTQMPALILLLASAVMLAAQLRIG